VLLQNIEKSWSELETYVARFEQMNTYSPEEKPVNYVGRLWLQRPSRIRLDYTLVKLEDGPESKIVEKDIAEPQLEAATDSETSDDSPGNSNTDNLIAGMDKDVDEMIFSNDIDRLYRYDRMENTLTIMQMRQESLPLFLALIVSEKKFQADRFKKRFQVESITGALWQGVPCWRAIVVPKDPQDKARREFWLDKETFLPIRTRTSVGTQQIDVFFKEFKVNSVIPPEILLGQVPSDVRVVDLTGEE